MESRTRDEHLFGDGPKRILAIDGGGVRGILSLHILREIEMFIRDRTGDPYALLCDYFDLIGGTSTGSVIAGTLACGKDVAHTETLYRDLAGKVFEHTLFRQGIFRPKAGVNLKQVLKAL